MQRIVAVIGLLAALYAVSQLPLPLPGFPLPSIQVNMVVTHNDLYGNGGGIGGGTYTDGGGNIAVDPQFISLTPGAGFLLVGTASPAFTGSGNGSAQGAHMDQATGAATLLLARLTAVAQQTPTP
jgi:uncharacterized protein (DUF697 family)